MDSWFSEEAARAFGWLALLAVLSLLGPYAQRGRHRRVVLGIWVLVLAFGTLCLAAGLAALVLGQPGHVVRPLVVSGSVITLVFAGLFRTVRRAYLEAELRRMTARDIG